MASHFLDLDQLTFESLLPPGFCRGQVGGELSYAWNPARWQGYSIRLLSSVEVATGRFRRVASDAIRIHVLSPQGKPWKLGKRQRYLTRTGTPESLKARILGALHAEAEAFRALPRCPLCGAPMRPRKSASGLFWGCPGFPTCRGTRPRAPEPSGNRAPEQAELRQEFELNQERKPVHVPV